MSKTATYDDGDFMASLHLSQGLLIDGLISQNHIVQWLRMLIFVIRHERESRRAIRGIRMALSLCRAECALVECIDRIYPEVFLIRDNYHTLMDLCSRHLTFWPFKIMMEQSWADWDDLAEDCAIMGDGEIRDALSTIGAALREHADKLPDWRESMAGIL